MAKGGGFTVDDSQFMQLARSLTGPQIKRAYRRQLKKSAEMLKKETDRLFAENTHLSYRKIDITDRKGRILKKASAGRATVRIYVGKKDMPHAKVHIMGDYMMKWFEMGTKERKTKGWKIIGQYKKNDNGAKWYNWRIGKGRRTGRIKPEHLFDRAQKATESAIFQSMKEGVKQEIMKTYKRVNRKRKK